MDLHKNSIILCTPNTIHNTYGFQIYLGADLSQKEEMFRQARCFSWPKEQSYYSYQLFQQGETENWIYMEYLREPTPEFQEWLLNIVQYFSEKYNLEIEIQ